MYRCYILLVPCCLLHSRVRHYLEMDCHIHVPRLYTNSCIERVTRITNNNESFSLRGDLFYNCGSFITNKIRVLTFPF